MYNVKTILSVFLFAAFFLCGSVSAQRVIPVPQQVEQPKGHGAFRITEDTKIYTNLKGAERERLLTYLSSQPSFLNREVVAKSVSKGISLQKLPKASSSSEGYSLIVNADGITVSSATDTGLFYGLQTLLQLAEPAGDNLWQVAAVRIEDAPRFDYRGLMIDVSRHFRTKEFLMKQIDALARYKLNRLHLHLTDAAGWRIEIKKYPRLTEFAAWRPEAVWKEWWNVPGGRKYCEETDPSASGGYYTQDDIRELVHYAADRHITIIPEIEMPAHSEEALAAYPELSCQGKAYTSADFCVGNEKTFTFLEDVLTEVMALFPSEYIHVGGDEAGKQAWKSCPKCQQRMKEEGLKDLNELQSYLIHRIEVFLNKNGRKLLGWDEIMEGGLAPNATVMSWRGEEGGLKAVKSGHRAVMTPGTYCYFDNYQDAPYSQPEAIGGYLPLSKVYSYNPVPDSFTAEDAKLLYGVQANLWAEYIPTDEHYEYMIYPRILALAEVAWSQPERKAYNQFRQSALREVDWLQSKGYHPFPLKKEIGDRPESLQPIKHLAFGKPVKYNAPYNEYYKAQGDKALTDGLRGGWTNADGVWQGFISRDRLDVTIDLEKEEEVRAVSADFMQVVGPEIFLPAEIIISASSDGENFTELTHLNNVVSKDSVVCIKKYGWKGETRARYIRYQAHSDKNIGGWIFTDEIVVEGGERQPVDYVNPFVGTTNYGTTNPGAVCPQGMMSVVPFNVMGAVNGNIDKDSRWWSTPYEYKNTYFTGYAHVNLSGVGCPELGSLLLMPTTGELNVDYMQYGSSYKDEQATPGYYSNYLTKYGIKTEVTATPRTGRARFTFPAGQGNILLNLGEGLTNESGATVRFVSDTEIEGSKVLGTFCYNPNAVFPIYFVMKINKAPKARGYWKQMRKMGVEAEWDNTSGTRKLYPNYTKEMSGDDIGVWFTFDADEKEQVEVSVGVSFVSIANARQNLEAEQAGKDFEQLHAAARQAWNNDLSRILVEGGTEEQRQVFYTALYHFLIHPNILQDVNGQYPAMESGEIRTVKGNRYTVFSLWDTYRNVHQLMTLLFPDRQLDMVRTMLDMYREHGWMPKWELYGRETLTMEGDPSIPVIVDTWMKGLRDFDVETAYEAMYKSATLPGADNLMRPDADDYYSVGYVPLREKYDNSVSHALEYYIADYALSRFAKALGKKEDAELFYNRSMGYKHYYCREFGTLRPILPDGKFYSPFNPMEGADFAPSPGFHEGNSWNYTFYVPHDVMGLAKLMGGKKNFVDKLQKVFDEGLYDPANEPDIAYPYLFSYFRGEEWRTQKLVKELLARYFSAKPNGIPGNDDTGTMSAWAIFSMMGFYPDCPGTPDYTLTTPVFDKITLRLDPRYYGKEELVIRKSTSGSDYIKEVKLDGAKHNGFRITHDELVHSGEMVFEMKEEQ